MESGFLKVTNGFPCQIWYQNLRIYDSAPIFYFGGWFSYKMGLAGILDRYVDAFQGRLPQTILARHYSDYTPEKLIQIYKQANLKILS